MTRISQDSAQWIAEDGRRLLERYFVVGEICRSLSRIPLELQRQPSLYLRLEGWRAAPAGSRPSFEKLLRLTVQARVSAALAKSTVSEVHQRIGQPLAYARGSDQSRDCKGAIAGNTRPYF